MPPTALHLVLAAASTLLFAVWLLPLLIASKRSRFEFQALDFFWGVLLVGTVAAFALGYSNDELGFSERLLLASKTAQTLVFFAGFLFGLSLLGLFAAIRLLGPAIALVVSVSVAIFIPAAMALSGRSYLLPVLAILAALGAIMSGWRAARGMDIPVPVSRDPRRPPPRTSLRRSTRGLTLAILAGFFLGIAAPITLSNIGGEIGVGANAGVLLLAAGIPLSVLPFSFFLLHVAIDQPPGNFGQYFRPGGHLLNVLAGAIWAAGLWADFSVRVQQPPDPSAHAPVWAAAGLIASAWLSFVLFRASAKTKAPASVLLGLLFFSLSVLLTAL